MPIALGANGTVFGGEDAALIEGPPHGGKDIARRLFRAVESGRIN
jgi:hypothetical protein